MALDPRAKFLITAATDFAKANRESKTFLGSIDKSARFAARSAALLGTAAAAGLTALTISAARSADALAKTSDKLGIATEKLAALQLAGRLTGVQNEKMNLGLQRMTRRVAEAAQGTGEAQSAIKELGLDAAELARLPLDQQFQRIAIAMQDVDSQSDKIRLGFKLFDSEGVDLIRTLDIMGKDFARIEDEARRFGVALTRIDARKIEQANDAVERAETALLGIGTNIALAIAPIREDLANTFAEAALQSNGFRAEIQATMEALVVGANFATNSVRGIAISLLAAKLAALEVQEAIQETTDGAGLLQVLSGRGGGIAHALTPEDDRATRLRETRDEIDATGAAMAGLIGKLQSGDEALSKFRKLQADATARATASVPPPPADDDEGGGGPIFGEKEKEELAKRLKAVQDSLLTETEAIRAAFIERAEIAEQAFEHGLIGEQERNELKTQLARETADQLLDIEKKRLADQQKLEQQHQAVITGLRAQAVDTAIGLLHTLGGRSKALAIAAIVAEKAVAVARIIINTNAAAAKALAELGPIAGPPAAASITAWGYGLAAATTAVGIGQALSVGSGSTGTTLGTPTNPLFTDNATQQPEQQSQRTTEVHIHGSLVAGQDTLDSVKRWIGELTDADEVIIHPNSRQALAIRSQS